MADRVNVNPSTEPGGPDVLTDTISSLNGAGLSPTAEAQRAKVGYGGDGTFTDVAAGSPLPVTDAQMATLHTDLAAILTELLQKLEPADLNLLATAAKQDVTHTDLAAILAKLSDDPATQTTLAAILTKLTTSAASPLATRLSDGIAYLTLATTSDRLKVDVGGSLPAGTNNIGDVDVLTLPSLPAGSNAIGSVSVSNTSGSPVPVTDVTPGYVGPQAQSGYDVTTSSTTAVAARAGRSLIQVMNTSDTPIWIALDSNVGGTPAATTGSGYWLGPNGGSWSEAYTGAVRAKHDGTGTKRLSYVEW